MPLYDIEHVSALTHTQQSQLAQALTELHSTRFHTPKFFINVRFADMSNIPTFRGGRRVLYNRIIIRTRQGEMRTKEMYDAHCTRLQSTWSSIVGNDGVKKLRTIWVMACLTTGMECGIARPVVGEESIWMQQHRSEFEELAAGGDEDFIELVKELELQEDATEYENEKSGSDHSGG